MCSIHLHWITFFHLAKNKFEGIVDIICFDLFTTEIFSDVFELNEEGESFVLAFYKEEGDKATYVTMYAL
jgi:hypothetical protein